MRDLFEFPNPVNEVSARLVAGGVVVLAVLAVVFGLRGAAYVVLGMLAMAATLESVFAFCLGCKAFALLMKVGIIPEEVCERCSNIWSEPVQA